jgi:hypothetical protein
VLGKILAKGPKVGRVFPLHFSIPSCLSFACLTVNTQNEVWHKNLGHPNSVVLSHMLNSGLLGNKEQVSKNLSFDCFVCKLGKRVRLFRFLLMVVVPKNALMLCIVMYGAFFLLFLMLNINIL